MTSAVARYVRTQSLAASADPMDEEVHALPSVIKAPKVWLIQLTRRFSSWHRFSPGDEPRTQEVIVLAGAGSVLACSHAKSKKEAAEVETAVASGSDSEPHAVASSGSRLRMNFIVLLHRHVALRSNAFLDDDVPAVMATPGPTGLAPIPAVSRGAVVGPARESLSV